MTFQKKKKKDASLVVNGKELSHHMYYLCLQTIKVAKKFIKINSNERKKKPSLK